MPARPYRVRLYTHLYNDPVPDKMLVWVGASFEGLRDFPPEARRAAGYELRFEKKSRQTRATDLALARERLKHVAALRREEKEK